MTEITTLRELFEAHGGLIQTGPFSSQLHQSDYSKDGVPVVMPKDIRGGRIDENGIARVPEIKAQTLSRHYIKSGSIVFSRRGEISKCAYIDKEQAGFLCGTGCVKIEPPEEALGAKFLYYYLSLRHIVEWLERNAVGTTMLNLNTKIIGRIKIPIIPKQKQEDIVSILSVYDDLIENNQRRIQLLEQAARLLYREWFVHLRFPGHEHVSITVGVPKGWERENVISHLEFVRGVEPGSKNYMTAPDEGRVPFLRVGDFGSRSSNIHIDVIFAKGKLLKPDDVAITMDGTPGLVSLGMKGAFSSGIRKIVLKEECGIDWSFIYELLQSDAIQSTVERFAKGTTIFHASSSLNHMVFLKPTETLLDIFEDMTAPVLRQILLLNDQNKQLRDFLLSSGMVRKTARHAEKNKDPTRPARPIGVAGTQLRRRWVFFAVNVFCCA
ncbi:MAG TPA: hypothetical protein C5S50_09225 [Methanosarcinaceae archaeon]|nr:hypothetical protein [Methanosarcinaceae archaeon]